MSTSRRNFLKTTILAGAAATLPAASASVLETAASAPPSEDSLASGVSVAGTTRGLGIYPGDPEAYFGPSLALDRTTYRNLAYLRPAYHSSSYDYNLTAQLVTDGIKDTRMPDWVAVTIDQIEPLPKPQREDLLNHYEASPIPLPGEKPVIQIQLGGENLPQVDRLKVFVVAPPNVPASAMTYTVSVSDDGRSWRKMGSVSNPAQASPVKYPPDLTAHAHIYYPSIPLDQVCRSRYYRVELEASPVPDSVNVEWEAGQVEFYHGDERVQIGGPYSFTSAWMSAGLDTEWVYVDLGARCSFDRVVLSWIARAAEGSVQISDDAVNWRNIESLNGRTGLVDDIRLSSPAQARYVRVWMTRPTSPVGYILSELEVYGRGGPVAQPHAAAAPEPDGRLNLAGGAWRLQRANFVTDGGEALSKPGYKDDSWLVATVPGTALVSYLNAGALPDPNYGQNQLYISDSYFYSDFWYRTEFDAPKLERGRLAWLNFDGINWKADIYLNGAKIGRIEGGFLFTRFDVTAKLLQGQTNSLAVRVEKNATPGSCKQKTLDVTSRNGGALGADNPTFHASIGWDWIPTIRGRNDGIWGEVSLTTTGAVTLEDPFVTTTLPLPDTSTADVKITVDLTNHATRRVSGVLRGRFGDVKFAQKLQLEPSSARSVTLDPATHAALRLKHPQLWWPNGYGDPYLYDVALEFEEHHEVFGHKVLDRKAFKAGVRQMAYSEQGDQLRIWVNGRRFIARGGNWGFSESLLRYRAREYDAALRYHREMNFTMVRNWVGQIGETAFYEACDRYGIMVWQDFWLANPWDGPIPNNDAMFMANARNLIKRIRNHASVGLYCGRNEGYPPAPLESGIEKALRELHPQIHYIGSSADGPVSGHGPYMALPQSFYFKHADRKLHSEIGMPNIPPIESVRRMMPEQAIWPQSLDWGLHDYTLAGAQNGLTFNAMIENSYGGAGTGEEWMTLAQFINYDGYRAMFEAQSKYRMGVLLWMSHPCWPNFVWQTYDYYFEPTAAYYGSKKGSEPLHIQWNCLTETIEVVNYSGGNAPGLTAQVEVLNMDGRAAWTKSVTVNSKEDSTEECIPMQYPAGLTPVHFLRLTLTRGGGEVVSTNFYMRGVEDRNYRAIRNLPPAQVQASTSAKQNGNVWQLTTQIKNTSAYPALMIRLKAVRAKTGDRILPAIYSDNYVTLMPGEQRTITTELYNADTRGEQPRIVIGGFNTKAV